MREKGSEGERESEGEVYMYIERAREQAVVRLCLTVGTFGREGWREGGRYGGREGGRKEGREGRRRKGQEEEGPLVSNIFHICLLPAVVRLCRAIGTFDCYQR